MEFPVFDLHCDTALALLGENLRGCGSLKENTNHIDLVRAAQLPGYAQCFACFTTTQAGEHQASPVDVFERELATVMREVDRNQNMIRLAYTADDVSDNLSAGLMSAILTIEGPAGFGFDPELLQDLYQVGFRMSTLGWNEDNPLTGSHITGSGLSDLGKAYVREAQRLGMIVDVSHISDQGFWDIIDITQAPIVASHSNSRAVHNSSRNLTDEMFLAICKADGVVGINQYSEFLGNAPTLDTVCDHILHFIELDPSCKHIALGGDLDGCDTLASGFDGIEGYPKLAAQLRIRGLSDFMIMDLFWNNAIGVMKRCCI